MPEYFFQVIVNLEAAGGSGDIVVPTPKGSYMVQTGIFCPSFVMVG